MTRCFPDKGRRRSLGKIRKGLQKTAGYTMTDLVLSISLFAIGIIPIYQMMIGGARIQNRAVKTYQATLESQVLLQEILGQIEIDLEEEYKVSRGLVSTNIKPWLKPGNNHPAYRLSEFLGENKEQDLVDGFLYEVYIWQMESDQPKTSPISILSNAIFAQPERREEDPWEKVRVEIGKMPPKYFTSQESLVWPSLGTGNPPVAIGEISYSHEGAMKIRANGIQGDGIQIEKIEPFKALENKIKLRYSKHTQKLEGQPMTTHELIAQDDASGRLRKSDLIQLEVDLTTFPESRNPKVIRIENKTQASLNILAYHEKNQGNVSIYPVQSSDQAGSIVLDSRDKLEASKNFVVGIIIKEDHKILSKIVDIYSYDYNKR